MKNIRLYAPLLFLILEHFSLGQFVYFASPGQPTIASVCGTNSIAAAINTSSAFISPYHSLKAILNNSSNVVFESQANFSIGFSGSEFPFSIPGSAVGLGPNVLTVVGTRANNAKLVPNNSITIDGVLSENYWNSLPNIGGFMVPCGGCNTSTMANAFAFNIFYDSINVYIGVKVIDNTLSTAYGGGVNDFQNDGIEIYLDPLECNCNYLGSSPASVSQVVQLRVGFNAPDNSFNVWPGGPPTRTVTGIRTAVRTFSGGSLLQWNRVTSPVNNPVIVQGTGYSLEMAIPLETFFGTYEVPAVNRLFGFDVAINDNQFGGGRTQQLQWGNPPGFDNLWNNAAVFGNYFFGTKFDTTFTAQPGSSSVYGVLTLIGVKTPAPQATVTISGDCSSNIFVQAPASGSGSTNYWQTTRSAVDMSNPAINNYTVTAPIVATDLSIYLNTLDNSNLCWSESVEVEIKPKFDPYGVNNVDEIIRPSCNAASFSATGNAFANQKLFWQINTTGTSTAFPIVSTVLSTTSDIVYYINAQNTLTGCWSDPSSAYVANITLSGTIPNNPTTAERISTTICRGALVSVSGSSLANEIYYVQSSPTGTGTNFRVINNQVFVSLTGTFFANTLNTVSGCWSGTAGQPTFSVFDAGLPPQPSFPEVLYNKNPACTPVTLTFTGTSANNLEGNTWYWQLNTTDTSKQFLASFAKNEPGSGTLRTVLGFTVTASGLYSVRNFFTGGSLSCWSAASSLVVSILGKPEPPPAPIGDTLTKCEVATRTFSTIPGGNSLFIVSSDTSEVTNNSPSTGVLIPFSTSGTYFLRARTNFGTGFECWSDPVAFQVSVARRPSRAPNPVVIGTDCGVQTITSSLGAGSGIQYYWQTSLADTSRTNKAKNLLVTASGTYFLLASNDSAANCTATEKSQIAVEIGPRPIRLPPVVDADTLVVQNDPLGTLSVFTVSGGIINWYTSTTPGSLSLGSMYAPPTSELGEFTYYITETAGLCVSPPAVTQVRVVEGIVTLDKNIGITPDGNGKNDEFKIPYIANYPSNKVVIFDKWGNVVYEKQNYSNNFRAENIPGGSYYYLVDLGDGKSKPFTGTLTIVK